LTRAEKTLEYQGSSRESTRVQVARQTAKLDALGRRLSTLSFDGDVWSDSLEELRVTLRAEGALAYRVSQAPTGWDFEFLHAALAADPEVRVVFDAFTKYVVATSKPWPAYNPARPARWQRNRAVSESDLSRSVGPPRRLARLYEAMGAPWKDPDQARVLVCDGSRLLGWVGVVGKGRFHPRVVTGLQRLVPAFRSRLMFDELARERDLSRAALDAAFDAIAAPSLLIDPKGRVLHLNEAARSLQKSRAEVFTAASQTHEVPDSRCEVRRVRARGLPAALLVTIRSSELADFGEATRCWGLTPRQLAVFELVVAGLSNKQVASRLGISEGTVELHMTAIMRKARVESRAALLALHFTSEARSRGG
jgi:DNA-binding CsgD family transcriptional regulator/PAS domain-containing protein